MLLFRFSQIKATSSEVKVQLQKEKRFAKHMANRQLVVPANIVKQQIQQVSHCISTVSTDRQSPHHLLDLEHDPFVETET